MNRKVKANLKRLEILKTMINIKIIIYKEKQM